MKLILSTVLAATTTAQLCPLGQGYFPNPVSDDGDLVVNHDGTYLIVAFGEEQAAEFNNQFPLGCASAPGSVPVFGGFETGAEGDYEMCCYPNPDAVCGDGSFPTGDHYCASGCGTDEFCLTPSPFNEIGCCPVAPPPTPEPATAGDITVEGVSFTLDQSARALHLVNTLCTADLDAFLTSSAAANLVASRPYMALSEVGTVPYVGPAALMDILEQTGTIVEVSGQFFTPAQAEDSLALVNGSSETDLDAFLNSLAAANLAAASPFATLAEVDAVSRVGPTALASIRAAASSCNLLDVEGVAFTQEEADAVVNFVNAATTAELDSFLNSLAVAGLVNARPYGTVFEVAARPRVGPSALTALRNYAA